MTTLAATSLKMYLMKLTGTHTCEGEGNIAFANRWKGGEGNIAFANRRKGFGSGNGTVTTVLKIFQDRQDTLFPKRKGFKTFVTVLCT